MSGRRRFACALALALATSLAGCRNPSPAPDRAGAAPRGRPTPAPAAVAPAARASSGPSAPTRALPGPCSSRIVWGSGDPPAAVTYAYDAEGRLVATSWDGDGDGEITEVVRYAYPSPGEVEVGIDADLDGRPERRERQPYGGNLALVERQCEAATSPGIACRFDAHRNLVAVEWSVGDKVDLLSYDYGCWP